MVTPEHSPELQALINDVMDFEDESTSDDIDELERKIHAAMQAEKESNDGHTD